MPQVMKQLIRLIFGLLKIDVIARFFVVGNMSVTFIDCATTFYKLYAFSFQLISLSFFVLSYFVILYWKKVKQLPLSKTANFYFVLLRLTILIMLIGPIAFDNHWHRIPWNTIDGEHTFKMLFEAMEIFGIEVVLEIFYYIYQSKAITSNTSSPPPASPITPFQLP